MRAAFLVVMSRSLDLAVQEKKKIEIILRIGAGEYILKWLIRTELP